MNLESLRRRLSSDEINALPLCHYEGPIHLVRSLEDWEKALPDLQQEQVLGFDTETRPSFRKGRINTPSLVQLATARAVYLVQLSWWPFGPELAGLLADPAVIKAGVAIGDDMRELARLYPFKPAGMVDLGMVARAHQLTTQGLRTLAANLFGQRISKFLMSFSSFGQTVTTITTGSFSPAKPLPPSLPRWRSWEARWISATWVPC